MANGGYLPAHAHFLLDQACVSIGWAFDTTPYLVGSALDRADYRDVDVRVILADEVYDRWFGVYNTDRTNPLWSLLSSSISLQLRQMTGLPIDFQLQQFTAANKAHHGPRDPLGIFPGEHREGAPE